MYRPIVFVIFLVEISVADNSKEICEKLFKSDVDTCCPVILQSLKPLKPTFEDELQECYEKSMSAHPCDEAVCVAKKKGYYAADGSFDRESYSNLLKTEFNFNADLFTGVKENCLEADISKYGPSNMCDFLKMRNCFEIQMFINCPEWSDNDYCSDMKELVKVCTTNT